MKNSLEANIHECGLVRMPGIMKITGLGRSTLYKMIKAGEMPPLIKIGRRASAMSFPDLMRWIDSRRNH